MKELKLEELLVIDGGINWQNVAECTAKVTVGTAAVGSVYTAGIGFVPGVLIGLHYGAAGCILANT